MLTPYKKSNFLQRTNTPIYHTKLIIKLWRLPHKNTLWSRVFFFSSPATNPTGSPPGIRDTMSLRTLCPRILCVKTTFRWRNLWSKDTCTQNLGPIRACLEEKILDFKSFMHFLNFYGMGLVAKKSWNTRVTRTWTTPKICTQKISDLWISS